MGADRQAVQSFASGRHILGPSEWNHIQLSLKLSVRELQIAQHVFDDSKVEAIAADLNISVHTINTHFQRLYLKLGVRSRSQLVVRIIRECLKSGIATTQYPSDPNYVEPSEE